MKKDNPNYKLTDEEFEAILIENNGHFSKTAQAIRSKYDIAYSRQAVRERAKNFKDVIFDCRDEMIELAEDSLKELLKDESKPIRARATLFVLSTLGNQLGYGKTGVIHAAPNTKQPFQFGDKLINF